jgi:hypothetical protein
MKRIKAPKDSRRKTVMISSLLLLIALPLVIIGATQENLDNRNQAYQEYTVSDENPCVISFPNVNPYTLEVGKSFTILVDAEIENGFVSNVLVSDSTGKEIYTETYEGSQKAIASNFIFTPERSGEIDINGILTTNLGESIACKISSPYDIKGATAISSNTAPSFTTTPELSTQIIQTGDTFEYLLTAEDVDGDRINYSTSFTPYSPWLRETVIEDGSNGKLTIKFRGSTSKPASYLANIFIHDGYSTHLRSQSWVISVSQDENDKPVITIIQPTQSLRLNLGDTFKTAWSAQDLNLIEKYQLYFSSNPANEDTWITIDDNIPAKTTEYIVNTKIVDPGTYKLIAKAIDNQDPEAFGIALTDEIVVSSTISDNPDEPDDIVTLAEPQVTNMSPVSTDEVTNTRVTVKATIIAGEGATLSEDTVSFLLDDVNKTPSIKLNKITDSSFTVIYQTDEDFTAGLHKAEIYFKDSKEQEISKSWTFTIKNDTDDINTDSITFFGIELAKRTAIIIGIGIAVVLIAIIVPVIIFAVWKEDNNKDNNSNPKLPPTVPSDTPMYTPTVQDNRMLRQKVESTPKVEDTIEEDSWDKYSVAKPTEGTLEVEEEYLVPQKDQIVEEPKVEIQQEPTPPVQETPIQPTIEEFPDVNVEQPEPQKAIETPEPILDQAQPFEEQPTNSIPEPVIPEPIIPAQDTATPDDDEAIQQLYSQIQQIKQDENTATTTVNS